MSLKKAAFKACKIALILFQLLKLWNSDLLRFKMRFKPLSNHDFGNQLSNPGLVLTSITRRKSNPDFILIHISKKFDLFLSLVTKRPSNLDLIKFRSKGNPIRILYWFLFLESYSIRNLFWSLLPECYPIRILSCIIFQKFYKL